MLRLAHLSDLHFGAIDLRALAELKDAVESGEPDAVIVTGDLTQSGRRREFEEAARFLEGFSKPILITPGNHDAPVYSVHMRMADPWRRFRRILGAQTDTLLALPGAQIVGLNSAQRARASLDWSKGRLSSRQIAFAVESLHAAPEGAVRIVALHHPVIPGPGRAGAAVVSAAQRALSAFARADADIILTGHAHVADASVHSGAGRPMIVARAGTASSTRVRGETPSFNLIEIEGAEADIRFFRFGEEGYRREEERRFIKNRGGWRTRPGAS